ncbi:MAG TPA: ORF6N domain-containing protein [Ferruginibacter sp.]|nr:ORF6N domain-containing protein [Ferruginibacter sp.]
MTKSIKMPIIPDELVMNKIYIIRGQKVMLDFDLAKLYVTEAKRLKETVRRNINRFPADFMFELTRNEYEILRSQIASSSLPARKAGWGGTRYMPMAFTEQGVAMLSSVLNSSTAISVNIQIIRVFTKMRALLMTQKDILLQLEKIEKKMGSHDEQIALIFGYLKKLLTPIQQPRQRIGFRRNDERD